MPPVEHEVKLYKDNNNVYKVTNGHELKVKRRPIDPECDGFFFNFGNTKAIILIPEKKIFNKQIIELPKDNNKTKIKHNAPKGKHFYAIWIGGTQGFAEAGSHPSMIIED